MARPWAGGGPSGLFRKRSVVPGGRTRERAARCWRSSTPHPGGGGDLDRRGVPRCRPAPTHLFGPPEPIAFCYGRRARARRVPGLRRAHEVPREGREGCGQAGRSPVVPSRRRVQSSTRSPGADGGVGPVTARKLRERSITMVADVAKLDEAEPGPDPRSRGGGRHIHALAHNQDPLLWRSGVGGARSVPECARATKRSPECSRPTCSRWSTGWPGVAGGTAPSEGGRCACSSTTSRARPARTAPRGHRRDSDAAGHRADAARPSAPDDPERGITLSA